MVCSVHLRNCIDKENVISSSSYYPTVDKESICATKVYIRNKISIFQTEHHINMVNALTNRDAFIHNLGCVIEFEPILYTHCSWHRIWRVYLWSTGQQHLSSRVHSAAGPDLSPFSAWRPQRYRTPDPSPRPQNSPNQWPLNRPWRDVRQCT